MDWQAAARRLGEAVGFEWLPDPLKPLLAARRKPLFVACSGGADSLFALLALWAYFERSHLPSGETPAIGLQVLHFNHALRGQASDHDARLVEEASGALGLPCLSGKAEWPDNAPKVSEAAAREARLRFFRQACRSVSEPCFDIATGHHADDVVETVLMRLARGSGLQGLTAPRPLSQPSGELRFLRPLIGWERSRIQAALEACGIPWREDASNESDRHHRNRLRNAVIPAWQAASDRPIWAGVGRSRRLLEEDWAALEALTEEAWSSWQKAAAGSKAFPLQALRVHPVALQRRLLQRAVRSLLGMTIAASLEDALLGAIRDGAAAEFALSSEAKAIVEPGTLRVVESAREPPPPFAFRLPIDTRAYLPSGARIGCERVRVVGGLDAFLAAGACDDGRSVYVTAPEKQSPALSVRQRLAGDAFEPKGKSSPKKLSELLIERKVNVGERDQLPVVTDQLGQIVWVPGLPPASSRLLGPGDCHALRLTYVK